MSNLGPNCVLVEEARLRCRDTPRRFCPPTFERKIPVDIMDGDVIVWKAASTPLASGLPRMFVYVELFVPAEARRVSTSAYDSEQLKKCRVDRAYVVSITDLYGHRHDVAVSAVFPQNRYSFEYRLNTWVTPDSFNPLPNYPCGAGINVHTRREFCDQWKAYAR